MHLSRRLKCTTRCPSSVVRLSSVRRPSVVNFSHFWLLLWNHWTEFNETWQEARTQHPLPSLCFSIRSEKQDGRPGLWLAETFSTSPLKPLNGIQRNLTGSKISMCSTKFVFFGPIGNKMAALASDWLRHLRLLLWNQWTEFNEIDRISMSSTKFVFFGQIGKTRWPPWPLIGWDIFDFSSETAERNSVKFDRKQDVKILYQVCVFSGRLEKQDGRPGLWLAETFSTSPLKPLNGIQRNLTGSKISTSSTKYVFFGSIWKIRWPPWPLIGWDIFDFFSETTERNSTKLDRKQDLNVLYQVCVFRADRKNKMAALASDWLRHFWLLLWNRWTEFNETWQEAKSEGPLASLRFSGWSEKQDGRPGLWLAETFLTSPLKPLNRMQRNLTGSKISTFSTKFVFFGPLRKTRWPPWPLIGWDIFDFSSETAEQKFNETWQEARSQHPLPSLYFSGQTVNKNVCVGRFLKKVAHCTQVHDMWPFVPLV